MNVRKAPLLLLLVFVMTGCGIMNPSTQVDVLKSYKYDVESVTDLKIAGKAPESILSSGNGAIASLPGIALALLRKDLPLGATVNMKVSNPNGKVANIGAFKYLIEIQGKPFVEGEVNEGIRLENNGTASIPFRFSANLFGVNNDDKGINKLLTDMFTREGSGFVVLKLKPSVKIGGKNIYYPGYITVDNDLLKAVKGLLK
ncbi:hypothetical protein [Chitinophaga agri]|uniref:Late embryogenesis abundant protein LEA-2 subgroup domain-containing protein n=1 Tax=Chitinophaga agri TaxID=2703787 RepID=A0A6B9ZEE7_9BACT|nr:hypothetical protein [Chitinophaga agri]QHS59694.1 hypothetical protein GWR21_08845 [Chitinophaga agri]